MSNSTPYDICPIDGRPLVPTAGHAAPEALTDAGHADAYSADLSPRQRREFEALAADARRNVLAYAGRLKSAATIPCSPCNGTGIFATRYENGKPAGHTGDCYRCNGKGRQTGADQARNHVYDALYFAARG